MKSVVPAIIPESKEQLLRLLPELDFADEIQIDVVDGKFVPFISWPYSGDEKPELVKSETDKFTLEVDLMVEDPITAAEDWIKAGADMLVFHIENISLEAFKAFVLSTKVSVGIAAGCDTPYDVLEPYLKEAEYIQLMGIAKIGSQGQPFDVRVLDRIKLIKAKHPDLLISIDGSVNNETILQMSLAGAHRFVSGSAILKSLNPAQAYFELNNLINN